MRTTLVLGTRPEIIKMAPVFRAARDRGHDVSLLHTGQHYSYEMDRAFFEDLDLPEPTHNLDVGSGPHGAQTAKMLAGIEAFLTDHRPDIVLVQGDTNTVLAGALAAVKLGISVGHVEAGLRSRDRRMPEEHNRIVADHLSDRLFAPTTTSAATLRREGIPEACIHVTGNTIVDAVLQNVDVARRASDVLDRLGLTPGGYVLMTAHRQENVDDRATFAGLLEGARRVGQDLDLPVVYPIHPRSRKMMQTHGLDGAGLQIVDPVDFLDFLVLEADAHLVLTDSGGVQEEACILKVPTVTLRGSTERPETIEVGANRLAGSAPDDITNAARRMSAAPRTWKNPFGDGQAGRRIAGLIETPVQRPGTHNH